MFVGFATLTQPFSFPVLAVDASNLPKDSDTTPSYRIYANSGLIGTGTLVAQDTGSITNASNASPIVITSAAHFLTTGMKVTTTGILGNTAANRVSTITVIDSNTFSLNGSTGNGAYTSGGTWSVTGLYACVFTPTIGTQFASGNYYDILSVMSISGDVVEQVFRFGVV